jgi:hypothetical protein
MKLNFPGHFVKSPVVAPGTDRRFFTGLAVAVALSVFAGFAPTYYLKGGTAILPLFPALEIPLREANSSYPKTVAPVRTGAGTARRFSIWLRMGA